MKGGKGPGEKSSQVSQNNVEGFNRREGRERTKRTGRNPKDNRFRVGEREADFLKRALQSSSGNGLEEKRPERKQ